MVHKTSQASSVFWSSGTPTIATANTAGLVIGLSPGQALIMGCSGTVTATVTVTVTIGGLTSIKVTTADGLTRIPYGSTEQFVATERRTDSQSTLAIPFTGAPVRKISMM